MAHRRGLSHDSTRITSRISTSRSRTAPFALTSSHPRWIDRYSERTQSAVVVTGRTEGTPGVGECRGVTGSDDESIPDAPDVDSFVERQGGPTFVETVTFDDRKGADRWQGERYPALPFGRDCSVEIEGRECSDRVMIDESRLQEKSTRWSDEAGGASHQRPHLFTGSKPRREEFGVDVQEHDHVDAANSMKNCFGSDEDIGRRVVDVGRGCRHFDHGTLGRAFEFFTKASRAGLDPSQIS